MGKGITFGLIALLIITTIVGIGMGISYSNKAVSLTNEFTQKQSERTAFYDKMWKTISQKSQIAVQNDSSFRKNIDIIMTGRKDGDGLLLKMVTESNPNANYTEVASLYKDLSRTVEAERVGFFEQEKVLQDVKLQHDNLVDKFPSSLFLAFLGKNKKLDYKPITSTITDEVMRTGKDDNIKLF